MVYARTDFTRRSCRTGLQPVCAQAKGLCYVFLSLIPFATAQTPDLIPVASKVIDRKTRLPGEFLPFQKVDIHARVTGFVDKVEVDRGAVVKKGQVLITLVAPEMTAQVAEAEARVQAIEAQRAEAEAKLIAAQSTYGRIQAASATPGAIAANEMVLAGKAVDAARAVIRSHESSLTAARAAVAALKDLQSYLRVTAPFDGLITERFVHPGALAGPSGAGPLLTLEQNSRLRLVVAVPESDIGGIVAGARVPFTVPAYPGQIFHGVIARIARSVDAKTRTMPVELDVDNSRALLAPGMYPELQWPIRRSRPSLLVPPTAIVTTTERTFVIRNRDGRAEWVNISRGVQSGDLIEVFGALDPGDQIVKRASDEIREGAPLRREAAK